MKRRSFLVLAVTSIIALLPVLRIANALTVPEAILRARPAVALVRAEIRGEVTTNCGAGPVTVRPAPFVETGTGWFVDGRGYLITNGHVVDPAYRLPPWVVYELKKKAIDLACVEPVLRERGLTLGQQPDLEDKIRPHGSSCCSPTARCSRRR